MIGIIGAMDEEVAMLKEKRVPRILLMLHCYRCF